MGRAGVEVLNENAGFDAFERAGAGVPNEKPGVLVTGLVSDCVAGELNKSPVGALDGVAVEEPNVNPVDATAGFSVAEGVAEGASKVNLFSPGVERAAVAVSLAG